MTFMMRKPHYALLWDDLVEGVFIGTPADIARKYCEVKELKFELKMDVYEEDGESIEAGLAYFVDGEMIDYLGDAYEPGNNVGNLESAYEAFFNNELASKNGGELYLCELVTPAQAEAFTLDVDDILDRITAREVRDEGLALDNEAAIRFWYYENKTA